MFVLTTIFKQFQADAKLSNDLVTSFRGKMKKVADDQFAVIKSENEQKRNDDDEVTTSNYLGRVYDVSRTYLDRISVEFSRN